VRWIQSLIIVSLRLLAQKEIFQLIRIQLLLRQARLLLHRQLLRQLQQQVHTLLLQLHTVLQENTSVRLKI